MRKRFVAAVVTLCLIFSIVPVKVRAAEYLQGHGTFGNNLTWEVYFGAASGATLWIKGSGAIPDYQSSDTKPWDQYVSSIKTISLQQGITSIGNYAFKNCSSVKAVNIPSSVRTIGEYAFQGCSGLTSIDIPSGVSTIKGYAFQSCGGIKTVYLGMTSGTIYYNAFSGISGSATIYYCNLSSTTASRIQGLNSSGGGWLTPSQIFSNRTIYYESTTSGSKPVYYTGVYIIYLDPAGGEVTPYRLHTERSSGSRTKTLSESLPTPTRKCYTFACWSRVRNDPAQALSTYKSFTNHTTIYAVWRPAHTGTPVDIPAVPATCTTDGKTAGTKCPTCNEVITAPQTIPATGHTPGTRGNEVITKEPTCTKIGEMVVTYTCITCGAEFEKTETIPELPHTEVDILAVPATCTTDGSTAGKKCSVCGTVTQQPQVIPAAHTNNVTIPGRDAGCENKGLTAGKECTACGTVIEPQTETDALGHAWNGGGVETVLKQPTCKDEGEKRIEGAVCTRCNTSKEAVTQTIPKTAHTWGSWTTVKEPTVTEKGSEERECSVCNEKETRDIPAKPEEPKNYTVTFDSQGGSAVASQSVTGGQKVARPADPIKSGHTFDGWFKEAECTNAWSFDTDTVTGNLTLYAKWTKDGGSSENPGGEDQPKPGTSYTVTFDPNGGTGGTTLTTGTDGRLAALPGDPERSGYSFTGWYTGKSDGDRITVSTVFQSSATVYAHWSEDAGIPDTTRYRIYTPSHVAGGDFSVSHHTAVEGARVTVELQPRSRYELDWMSVTNLTTGRELDLNRRYSDEYTFVMPASDVEVEIVYTGRDAGGTYYVSPKPPASDKPVKWYYSSGHIYHVTDGLVPDGSPLTRDMLISVLYNLDPASSGAPTFWATNNHIVPDIYMSWLWGSDKSISREQTAMILFCYAQHRGGSTFQSMDLSGYADYSQIRPAALRAMSWARATGLLSGTSDSTLSPRSILSCQQACAILARFLSNIVP